MASSEEQKSCPTCAGCGRIANDDEGTPWKYWLELPLGSAVAVVAGIVRPLPCPFVQGHRNQEVLMRSDIRENKWARWFKVLLNGEELQKKPDGR